MAGSSSSIHVSQATGSEFSHQYLPPIKEKEETKKKKNI
jgi:hypothetical protein